MLSKLRSNQLPRSSFAKEGSDTNQIFKDLLAFEGKGSLFRCESALSRGGFKSTSILWKWKRIRRYH